jgi:2-isopropylmalate synthase
MNAITKDRRFSGSGSDTDIITSSARAYVSAINKLLRWNMRRKAQESDEESLIANGGVGDAEAVTPKEPSTV